MRRNRSMPNDSLIPVLGYPDVVEATRWLCAAFGFTERWRAGPHRAQLRVSEGSAVAVTEGDVPHEGPGRVVDHVMVRVEDVDAMCERARARGARVVAEPVDLPYGERQCTVLDHAGRPWVFTQSVDDVDPQAWGATPGRGLR